MADNWSSSVLTLTNRGDWAKWDFTISDSATADDFNGDPNFDRLWMSIRYALTAASRHVWLALIVNDTIAVIAGPGGAPARTASSSGSWVSANRYAFKVDGGMVFATVEPDASAIGWAVPDIAPFVVGTNTVRLISFGRQSDNTTEPFELDVIYFDTGDFPNEALYAGAYFNGPGTDDLAESTPAIFGTHSNGNPFNSPRDDHGWLLRATDATTGTAAMPTFEIVKFCPSGSGTVTAKLRVTDGANNPISGIVGVVESTLVSQIATLDGAGKAEFVIAASSDVTFWYGGTDDWMPRSLPRINDGFRFGCSGWHVGCIGVGR